jgi:hypothetical protein
MWRDGTVYDPAVIGRAGAAGKRREAQDAQARAIAMARAAGKAKRYLRDAANSSKEVALSNA